MTDKPNSQIKAAALAYDSYAQSAPKVVASGRGAIALQIIKKAKEHNIEIFQNKALVDSLLDLELDQEIPPALYLGVANVFVWLLKTKQSTQIS